MSIHVIRFRPQRWGGYSAPPDPIDGIKGPLRGREGKEKWGERDGDGREEEGREGREREGMEEGRGKVKEGMGMTGQDMGWDGGRERERSKDEGRRGATAPKLQFLAPPLTMTYKYSRSYHLCQHVLCFHSVNFDWSQCSQWKLSSARGHTCLIKPRYAADLMHLTCFWTSVYECSDWNNAPQW